MECMDIRSHKLMVKSKKKGVNVYDRLTNQDPFNAAFFL